MQAVHEGQSMPGGGEAGKCPEESSRQEVAYELELEREVSENKRRVLFYYFIRRYGEK